MTQIGLPSERELAVPFSMDTDESTHRGDYDAIFGFVGAFHPASKEKVQDCTQVGYNLGGFIGQFQ